MSSKNKTTASGTNPDLNQNTTQTTKRNPANSTQSTGNDKRWLRLAAGVVMLFFAGIIYAWSILKAPLAQELAFDNSSLGLNFTITMGFFCIGGIVGSFLQKKVSKRSATQIGAALCLLGFGLVSQNQGHVGLLFLSYGVLAGLGIGIVYNVIISTVSSHFPDKRATASGVMMMGFGTSTLLLGSLMNRLFSSLGWRKAYLFFGAAIFIVLFAGSFLMKAKQTAPKAINTGDTAKVNVIAVAPKDMLKRRDFWYFYFITVLLSLLGTGVISFGKDVALSTGAGESLAVLLVGALSVSNGLSRIFTGYLFDARGRYTTMLFANTVAFVATLLMLAAVCLQSPLLVALGLISVGFSYGSIPTIGSGFTGSVYGSTHFPTNFSIANTQLLISSFSATLSGSILKNGGSYAMVFGIFLTAVLMSFVLNLLLQRRLSA